MYGISLTHSRKKCQYLKSNEQCASYLLPKLLKNGKCFAYRIPIYFIKKISSPEKKLPPEKEYCWLYEDEDPPISVIT